MEKQPECLKQVAVADHIVLTKTDIAKDPVSAKDVQRLGERLKNINPSAIIQDRNDPRFSMARLFNTGQYNPSDRPDEVQTWLNAEAYHEHDHDAHEHHHHSHDHDHGDGYDVNRHGTDIQAYSFVIKDPISTLTFTTALELLIADKGENLLRVKGLVHLAEMPGRPAVIHGVQHVFHEPVWLDDWPEDDRQSKLVFITRNIPKKTIEAFFKSWQSIGSEEVKVA
ncbi:MAG: GTP-binding protein [Boseongicola sp.]|nr:GTP-binding protein [Boseongicola sp.]